MPSYVNYHGNVVYYTEWQQLEWSPIGRSTLLGSRLEKHSSLFCPIVSLEEKSFTTSAATGLNPIKLFWSVIYGDINLNC